MTKKILLQAAIIIASFFLVWFGFSQIDFMKLFSVKERSEKIEHKLGDMIWNQIEDTEDIVTNDTIVKSLDKLLKPICEANDIDRDSLKVHIIKKDEINAFALPNNHLVVYTGLIEDCKRQEALQGVLGHEIAHIEKNHVMKKLSKEIGYSVLISAAGGTKGSQIAKEILKTLSSSAYDRKLEKEADITSVKYMLEADIDPRPMADFMYQMAQDSNIDKNMYWIADHPESEERAKYILDYLKGKKLKSKATLSEKDWKAFQEQVKEE
ncbi:M48 family metallopeptidase [Flavobacterium wongokense]|uniref:M48 family metallopeptidase n=1 Tax=Flavobacterium wongokense TaxID=2910674 RepID=UPI001F3F3D14|nr:M48 family metallopeptidase [Flavobacterium sp. WG47]MCF6131668.1 M48 family metallopeptidase [Flavobacterium sp. WG47]